MFPVNAYPFQNARLPLEERVEDLVSRFTLEEKIELMHQYQAEIPRLGVKPYKHGTEGAHGIAWLGEATVFPQNIGLAATWNPELMRQIGSVIGEEARIYYQKNAAINGLTVWAPTVDMERDPRWGRTEEAYGEDPHLTGRLTTELVKGIQGDHPFYYKAAATLKHFYANNNEADHGSASVSIDPRNKREYYLKAFEPAFREGGAASMMTAYNSVNGVPCNLNAEVNDIVKGEWGMKGFVVSDAADVLGTVNDHGYTASYAEAVAASVKSGIDSITDDRDLSLRALRDALEQGLLEESDLDGALRNTFRVRFRLGEFDPDELNPYASVDESRLCSDEGAALSLQAARESIVLLKNDGLLPLNGRASASIAVIGPLADEALTDWYSGTPKYRISPLDGIRGKMPRDGAVSYCDASDRVKLRAASGLYIGVTDDESRALSAGAGTETAAVFRLDDWGWGSKTLRDAGTGLFVTETDEGTFAAVSQEAKGWFVKEIVGIEPASAADQDCRESGETCRLTAWNGSPVGLNGDRRLGVLADQASAGLFGLELVEDGIKKAVEAAKAADIAVVAVGNVPYINGKEEIDRKDIVLPPRQQQLIQAVYQANPNTVVVIVGSYPFAVNWEQEHIPAILYTSHSAQELGSALSDVLFGDYNPAGRLPMTWYRSSDQLPDIMDYDLIKGKRTYQYFDGDVLYPFGYGLSYTSFSYSPITLSEPAIGSEDAVSVHVTVTNTGRVSGEEVAQLYVHANHSKVTRPIKTLKGFQKVALEPGESKELRFMLPASELAFWDVSRERYAVESGTYTLYVGGSSMDRQESAELTVDGEAIPPRSLSEYTAAVNYDDYHGVYLDECTEGGSSIRVKERQGWIAFKNVEIREEAAKFTARISGAAAGAELEIRLGSPSGTLAGRASVPRTGGSQAWTTLELPVEPVSGRQDVYLLLKGAVSLSRFKLTNA